MHKKYRGTWTKKRNATYTALDHNFGHNCVGAVQCTWVHMYQMTLDAGASGVVVDICVRRLREEINAWCRFIVKVVFTTPFFIYQTTINFSVPFLSGYLEIFFFFSSRFYNLVVKQEWKKTRMKKRKKFHISIVASHNQALSTVRKFIIATIRDWLSMKAGEIATLKRSQRTLAFQQHGL